MAMLTDRGVPLPASARQVGVFTLVDSRAAGATHDQTSRMTTSGAWVRVVGEAYCRAGTQVTVPMLLAGARLTWPRGVVMGPLAAIHYGAPLDRPDMIDVARMCSGRRPLHGLQPRVIPLGDDEWRDNGVFRVTHRTRSYVDTLAFAPFEQARRLLVFAFAHGILTRSDLVERLVTHPGMHGNGQIRRLLRESAGGAWSPAEHDAHELLRRHGITGWSPNMRVRDAAGRIIAVVDIAFGDVRLAIEVDGESTHARSIQKDSARRNRLVAAGWTVLSITPADIRDRPDHVVSLVATTIDRLRGTRS
ncbi:DUF559 domain-containing protein [Flavimobilis sp. GY10621]|uniref:DUF559 domain-containing protein n=1 Tax=Flavimobilis rhizosphaerae TaxID=2775421 RepID=A0ABR9DTY7_9MICO|nr:DUF559 domain-containing protein [Flavimobilis rhizosphaerae]MBD9700389.1 DUF559 domain-containing protein [Flavimobilis rhizosphaerae]